MSMPPGTDLHGETEFRGPRDVAFDAARALARRGAEAESRDDASAARVLYARAADAFQSLLFFGGLSDATRCRVVEFVGEDAPDGVLDKALERLGATVEGVLDADARDEAKAAAPPLAKTPFDDDAPPFAECQF